MAKHISDDVSTVTDVQVASERSDGENLGHLIVIGGVAVGHVFDLEKVQVHIGRDASADVQILEPGISRIHARITRTREGIYLLEDAGSRNGTYCNNNRVVGSYQLRTGDKIQLGSKTVIKFAYRDGAEADFHQAMYDAANRDGLTDIFNRRYFEERLGSEFDLASRYGHPLSLLMLDLDHFKEVNDTHGHPVGDQVLKEFADLVYKATRTDDITARVGGEEF
jgi:two-component system cell cycle response regulator